MTPTHLKLKGFLRFSEETIIDFTRFSAAAITGSNGNGKSSLCTDAITFALFGKARVRDCLNILANEGYVELTFHHRGENYAVTRSILRDKGQRLSLAHDGKDLTARLLTKTQEKLNNILGFSEALLRATCLSSQDQVNFFSELPSPERANILMELLDLGIWEKKKDLAQRWCLEHKDLPERGGRLRKQINDLQDTVKIREARLVELADSQSTTAKQLQIAEEEANTLIVELSTSIGEFNILQEQTKQLFTEIGREEKVIGPEPKEIEILEKEQKDLERARADAIEEQQNYTSSIEEGKRELLKLNQSIHTGQALAMINTDILNRVPCRDLDIFSQCELLKQAHDTKQKQQEFVQELGFTVTTPIKEVLDYLITKFNEQQKLILALRKAEQLNIVTLKNLEHALSQKIQEINYTTEYKNKRQKLECLKNEYKEIKIKLDSLSNCEEKKRKLETTNIFIEEIKVVIKEIETEIITNNTYIKIDSENIIINKKKADVLLIEEQLYGQYKTLIQAYTDIPALLFQETLPWIEQRANQILATIMPEKSLSLRTFKETQAGTQKRVLDLICHSSEGDLSFESLSGSEKFRFSLAMRIAMAATLAELHATPLNMLIIDEGMGSLDADSIPTVKHSLREIAKRFDLCLVVTHLEELVDTFPIELRIQKAAPYIQTIYHEGI